MDAEKFFGSYLKTTDVKQDVKVTIVQVEAENIGREGNEDLKLLVFFEGLEKPMVLNKVNFETLKELTGTSETDSWLGETVILYTDPNVMFGGKRVGGLRIKPVKKG